MGIIHATEPQFEELLAEFRKKDEWRADQMPDEAAALRVFHEAYRRLQELGWREAMYAPQDQPLELIECGSTGIHKGSRDDQRRFWIEDAGDIWPSRAVLWRAVATGSASDSADG